MKRLNRKGFTLIELLAVVVIMGIILVVTIPSVLNTTNTAKEKQLKNAANTVADWYTKQYQLYLLDMEGVVDENFTNFHPNITSSVGSRRPFKANDPETYPPDNEVRVASLEAAGLTDVEANYDLLTSYFILNGNKVCVMLTASSTGSFYVKGKTNKKCSSTCKKGLNGSTSSSGITCNDENF